jgi:hypothetical protein
MGPMKNINQIFKNNKHLMDTPEVSELIDYCRELEENVIEVELNKPYDKEDILHGIIRDIYESCIQTLKDDKESIRFGETPRVDFEKTIVNLKEYIESINRLYSIRL